MTKQQKLQEIEQQIRKDIPRLMELTYGCIVENNDNKERSIYLGEVRQNEIYKVFKDCNDGEIWIDYENYFWLNDHEDFAFTIIGHKITLIDLFEWFSKIYKNEYNSDEIPAFNVKGKSVYADCGQNVGFLCESEPSFDFSKPYLEDQSERLIAELHYAYTQLKNKDNV